MNLIEHTIYKTDKGLRILEISMPHMHSAEIGIFIRTGPVFEPLELSGISHFLEHMMFRGTKKYPCLTSLMREVENYGGTLEASTSREHVEFFYNSHPKYIKKGLDVLFDILKNSQFMNIDSERTIILEEYLDTVNDDGETIDIDQLSRTLIFGAENPLARPILGTKSSIESITSSQIEAWHKKNISIENMVVSIAGNYDPSDVEYIKMLFADLEIGTKNIYPEIVKSGAKQRFHYSTSNMSQSMAMFSFLGIKNNDEFFIPYVLLWKILDGGMSSRLYSKICGDLGLAYDVDASIENYYSTGIFDIFVTVSHDNIIAIYESVMELLSDIVTKGVKKEEFEFAKRKYNFDIEMGMDDINLMTRWFGEKELYFQACSFKDRIDIINSATIDSVNEVAKQILNPDKMYFTLVGSKKRYAELNKYFLERIF
ncbi:MAG: pitrilysin family protein [Pseudomonadota bacterium]